MSTVIDYLVESYRNFPNNVACSDENGEITYDALWKQTEGVSKWLRNRYDMSLPIVIVGIKSVDLYIIIWSIIKAGGYYCVIDPMLPIERIDKMLGVLSPKVIITDQKYEKKIKSGYQIVYIIDILSKVNNANVNNQKAEDNIVDTLPLYIMFTSGTTGVPKGVVVNHRSVVDFINAFTDRFGISNDDIIGNQAPWDFDVSVKDIFSAVKTGAKLQIIPRKLFAFPKELMDYLNAHNVTTLIWAVSALRIISNDKTFAERKPSKINKVIFSGETMPPHSYNIWREQYPKALFVNVYGPTEITCNCTYHIQRGMIKEDECIPIGVPFKNESVFLLNESDELVSIMDVGVDGEICVSGTAVAMGYYSNKAATDKAFVQNPLNSKYREIIYRTGDLAFYNSEGLLVFNGRKDNQIKHNGHRIELEEIERALNMQPEIMKCCCVYKNEMIIAYIEGKCIEKEIIIRLSKIVPNYMIPSKFVFVKNIPLNSHGKMDRGYFNNLEIGN